MGLSLQLQQLSLKWLIQLNSLPGNISGQLKAHKIGLYLDSLGEQTGFPSLKNIGESVFLGCLLGVGMIATTLVSRDLHNLPQTKQGLLDL